MYVYISADIVSRRMNILFTNEYFYSDLPVYKAILNILTQTAEPVAVLAFSTLLYLLRRVK